jgi:hypothetical protein
MLGDEADEGSAAIENAGSMSGIFVFVFLNMIPMFY